MSKDLQMFIHSLPIMGAFMLIGIVLLVLLRWSFIIGVEIYYLWGGMF